MTHNDDENKQSIVSSRASGFSGNIRVAGDKSISHRSLMLSSQVLGVTNITGLLEGDDVLATAEALRKLGVDIERVGNGNWRVKGVGIGGLQAPSDILDMGNAGTGARLMMGLLASYNFAVTFTGDSSLRSRPMKRITDPLSEMGVRFIAREGIRLPLTMIGADNPMPITYRQRVASAQVKSAILLAGLNIAGRTTVIEPEATRDHTEKMLRYLGIEVDIERKGGERHISVLGHQEQLYKDRNIDVPTDPSSAAFPMVAALLVEGAEIVIEHVGINPLRTGAFVSLKEMGADIEYTNLREEAGEPIADIIVRYSPNLKGINIPAERAPSMIDEYPIVAIAAAFAEGDTVMNGLSELRVKESDRLKAIIDGLNVCGVRTSLKGDDLTIHGAACLGSSGDSARKALGGATVETHFDHRIAMSFLVMGMASGKPITVDDGRAISTSFPNFIELMNSCGAEMSMSKVTSGGIKGASEGRKGIVIAIDGPAASGKGTLARRLAEHFNYAYLDTGRLYRAVGLKLVYGTEDYLGKDGKINEHAAIEAAKTIDIDDLINPRLRQEKIGQVASMVSAIPEVREVLLQYQRDYAKGKAIKSHGKAGAVLDGRDIGTVVCPDADFKFFVTASVEARAKRRHKELQGQGIEVVYESVLQDLVARDKRDKMRKSAPLRPADDAVYIDTTNLGADEVFGYAIAIIENRRT